MYALGRATVLQVVKGEIELQDIDMSLAEKPEPAAFQVLIDQRPQAAFRHATRPGYARYLKIGACRRDVGIKAACR